MGNRPSLVCIGHSHVDAVTAAAAKVAIPVQAFNLWNLAGFSMGEGALQAVRGIREQLRAPVFSFVGGGLPLVFGMIVHPRRPYDFVLPERPELPLAQEAELVPYDAVHASMRISMQPFFAIMREIRQVSGGPVFHLESPPPCEQEIKASDPGWNVFYSQDDVIAPSWIRYKVWRLHSSLVRNCCEQSDITFLPHPDGVVDADGFLRPEFRGKPGHGNPDYGARVLQQMLSVTAPADLSLSAGS